MFDVLTKLLILEWTGSFDGLDSAIMTKCDWHEDYTEVPKCQRRNLFKKFYEKNCGCIVSELKITRTGHVMDGWIDRWMGGWGWIDRIIHSGETEGRHYWKIRQKCLYTLI